MADLTIERNNARLLKSLKAIYRMTGNFTGDSLCAISEIHELAEKTLRQIEALPKLSWIEIERKKFREKHGMTYAQAERFWYRESLSYRRLPPELVYDLLKQAHFERCWKEHEKRPNL